MGELVVNNDGGGGGRVTEMENMRNEEGDGGGGSEAALNVVRWEKFLPKMVLRVLLVEADDSTRQLITALLRKCNYKVAAVSDGLKAWEILKRKPYDIDLILTEVELPSVSGFALLTLIGEHEVCKNIPIIMMSAHDSVSTVYKCMLKGAADFLVKPVRKNELKNIWQHVWRRRASISGGDNSPQAENDAQQKVEATAENHATSNHSSGYTACIQRNRECIEKGSDAQSSCTKPDMEVEEASIEHLKDLRHSKSNAALSSDMNAQKHKELVKATQLLTVEDEAKGRTANTLTQGKDMAQDNQRDRDCAMANVCDNNRVITNASREVIDLIGTFDSYPKCSQRSSVNNGTIRVDSSPLLDLSLRRSFPSGSVNQITDERSRLRQSDGSAFSRYINRTPQSLHSGSASICNQQKEHDSNSDKPSSNNALESSNFDIHGPGTMSPQQILISMTSGQPGKSESRFPSPKQSVFSAPAPPSDSPSDLRFENLCTGYGSSLPPIFRTQSGPSPMQNPGSSGYHLEPSFLPNHFYISNSVGRNSEQLQNLMDRKASNATDQTKHNQGQNMESFEDRGHLSSANDQSASSSFHNPTLSRLNSVGSGNNVNTNLVKPAAGESGNDSSLILDEASQRSLQREAALNKFRLKRKDRCFEKKVRYESRKKLAEKRPRVKGQFVRQMITSEPQPMETEH